jgi:Lrp/AsnC family transcriptional regulator for asnA, asnC and gidA
MPVEIDEVDRKLLERLQDNARMSFKKIAEEIGVSESTIFVRVKKLRKQGVIKKFTIKVAPETIGKGLTAFILIKAAPQRYPDTLETLKRVDDVYEVYDVTGNYYAIAKIRTGSREQLAKIIDSIGLIEGIASTETAVVLRSIKEETRIKI